MSKKQKIAVIDDSSTTRRSIEQLVGARFELSFAKDGLSAIPLLIDNYHDAVIVDIEMDHINGLELIRLIRSSSVLSNKPVIAISGHADQFTQSKARLVGANHFIVKPFSKQSIIAAVEGVLDDRS